MTEEYKEHRVVGLAYGPMGRLMLVVGYRPAHLSSRHSYYHFYEVGGDAYFVRAPEKADDLHPISVGVYRKLKGD